MVVAVSPIKGASIDAPGVLFQPPELHLSLIMSTLTRPQAVLDAQLCAEMDFINSLFPNAEPQDLWIYHSGGWDYCRLACETKVLYSLLVSAVYVQPH